MALTETPVCDFGQKAPDFTLPGIDGKHWSLNDCQGENGTLIMFICNHCPYVKAIQARLVQTARELMGYGIGSVGIMPNDPTDYPEDSFENMQKIAGDFDYPFPYLYDEFQTVARSYGAVCTPDFFGYNANLELQYRGRFDASRMQAAAAGAKRDLFEAMVGIAGTGEGPGQQIHGMGCSIKWRP